MKNCHPLMRGTLAAAAFALPMLAAAHTGGDAGAHHGFVDGALHPFSGVDHLVAALAAGARAAFGGGRPWALVATYLAGLVAGALLAAAGIPFPGVEPMIAASVLVFGMALAMPTRRTGLTLAIVGGFAAFHGAAHAIELQAGAAQLAGMIAGTTTLLGAGRFLGGAAGRFGPWPRRIAGTLAASTGGALLVTALARL